VTLLLGIDVSTTGVKALLVDERGRVTASRTTPLEVSRPRALWSEQDPAAWWTATVASVRGLLATARPSEIGAVGLSGQMHGLVLLGEDHRVLRPAILWNDQRTAAECAEIRERAGGRRALISASGNDALTGFTAPKILWVRRQEPDVYARVRGVLLPKDYVRLRLTGVLATDKADGSGTLLFDLPSRTWSQGLLSQLEIPAEWLPPAFEGPERTGAVSEEAALATGLPAGTPVVAGGGDQAAGAVALGAVEAGVLAVTLGTSGVVFASTDRPIVEPEGRLHAFCHAAPGLWHLMAVTLSAAGSLQWFRDSLAEGEDFEDLLAAAERVPAGSEGLFFTPYLSGERTPHPDPLARASFVGLTTRHTRAHLARAVLEGVAFSLADCIALFAEAGLAGASELRIAGGGVRSALWRRICASVFDCELAQVGSVEGAALGAALLAGVGLGVWRDVPAACRATVEVEGRDEPEPRWRDAYAGLYPLYRGLYPALRPTFDRLGSP
jgi:xylulokinase